MPTDGKREMGADTTHSRRSKTRRMFLGGAGTAVAMGLAGCSDTIGSSGGDETKTLTMASELPDSHITSQIAKEFAEDFNSQADGLEVEVVPGGAYGSDTATAELTKEGEVELSYGSSAFYFYSPAYNFVGHPFVFSEAEHQEQFLKSDLGQDMRDQILESGNQHLLGFHYMGQRDVYSTKRLESPEHGEDITLRSPGITPFQELISEGFNVDTETIPSSEVYSNVETGLVDGYEVPPSSARSHSIDEVCDYINITAHNMQPAGYYIHAGTLEELEGSGGDLLRDTLETHIEDNKQRTLDNAEDERQKLLDKGMEEVETDRRAFFDRAEPLLREHFDTGQWSKVGTSYEEIREITGEVSG